ASTTSSARTSWWVRGGRCGCWWRRTGCRRASWGGRPGPGRPRGARAWPGASASVKDVRQVTARAEQRLGEREQGTILFLDEVHRFNKAQQDALLPSVESGLLVLIGATTENP